MLNAREFQQQIDSWAKNNFTYMDKIGYGMVEELGEYCHEILKSKQQIRRHALKGGVKDKDKAAVAFQQKHRDFALDANLKDCLADGMIFTLHWTETMETFISFEETEAYVRNFQDYNENDAIAMLLQCLSCIFRLAAEEHDPNVLPRTEAQRTFNNFALIAKVRGWNWFEILCDTWTEVRKRDWQKYPTDGKTH